MGTLGTDPVIATTSSTGSSKLTSLRSRGALFQAAIIQRQEPAVSGPGATAVSAESSIGALAAETASASKACSAGVSAAGANPISSADAARRSKRLRNICSAAEIAWVKLEVTDVPEMASG